MKKFLYGIIFFFVILIMVFLGVEKRKLTNMELVSESSGIWQHAGEESRIKEEVDDINVIYGSYKITEFLPTQYYQNIKYDVMPEQEVGMLLERIVIIKPEILITYDTERSLGTNGERDAFDGNYMLATYTVNKPEYGWDNLETDILDVYIEPDEDMEQAIGKMYFEQLTNQYFLLERCEDELGEKLPEWTEDEKEELLGQIYGEYQVIKFLPTKYYPALDSNGYEILPIEEADMMIGQEIVFKEDFFVTYDNYRLPNSYITGRIEDGFMIEKVAVQSPQYQVKSVRYEEIYGICEGMLAEELEQQEYVEIDVYPGYETNGSRVLPQLFLMDDGRIIMYSMGEYFLLKRNI